MSVHKVVERVPPRFTRRAGDWAQEGGNNTIIIMGTDRPGDIDSGLGTIEADGGGRGTGTVHIIAGRKTGDPDLMHDDAFVYLSQKTNADENLGTGGIEGSTASRPAAILVATDVRVGARGNVKIYIDDADKGKYIFISPEKAVVSFTPQTTLTLDSNTVTVKVGGATLQIDSGGNVSIQANSVSVKATSTKIDGPVTVSGDVTVTGGDVVADGISLKTHVHPVAGVQAGTATVVTAVPT